MATIRYLAEQAVVKYLNSVTLSAEAVAGMAIAVKDAPVIVCTAREWTENELDTNWYNVRLTVEIKGLASDGGSAFDALCTEVRNALRVTTIGTLLATAQAGIVFVDRAVGSVDRGEFTIQDDIWTETRELELICALTA